MADISQERIEKAIDLTADTAIRNEHYFCDLDGLAGDGDFGNSLATGFKVIKAELPQIEGDIGAKLLKISMLCSKHVGGSSGPIWGTGFMKAAMVSKGKTEVTLAELTEMVGAAVDGIMARGGAKLGDKTLLDALIPVHEKMKEMAESGDPAAVLGACAEVADNAIDETRTLVAHRGRASQVGDRSANTPDPGIVAIATILQDWCNHFGVERSPKAPELNRATA
ncbi:dihydroxyacetone kinase phosphoprotein-dependent L subunit [Altererythrobacter atlanticus]|uniref:PTS-dependent dihydroxyacetone kinase, ADP-binding subunit DhaL n=1 Tax=Croceibacterium atlanticum TaxID=1267766 RepID=A0A0F7KXQ1_9SPHN|nr:dihydroxyacetone kinase subunit DhaL [Croceibacterium atlanticum]AKH44016.1 PTS-dependent dihydroxyacetone kinase, ADP-binding subunit DhaL [Croceibacterium atlanticum]MBB5732323.1 dihydroxyacetone kinase phosphoprotein-dependent L subunit [Croceibacterium atlanticum]